jgi:hypothetical protein
MQRLLTGPRRIDYSGLALNKKQKEMVANRLLRIMNSMSPMQLIAYNEGIDNFDPSSDTGGMIKSCTRGLNSLGFSPKWNSSTKQYYLTPHSASHDGVGGLLKDPLQEHE